MLDVSYADMYGFEPYLPVMHNYNPINYEAIFDLLSVLEKMDMGFVKRGLIYGTSVTFLFSIQMLYIYFHLMLKSKTIDDFGMEYIL